jgi:hypothetical protein
MNREVHVRFWESPEVKVLRATRQIRPCRQRGSAAASPQLPDIPRESRGGRLGSQAADPTITWVRQVHPNKQHY